MKQVFISFTFLSLFISLVFVLINFQQRYMVEKEIEYQYHRAIKYAFKHNCLTEREIKQIIEKNIKDYVQPDIEIEVKHYQCYPKIMRVVLKCDEMNLMYDRTLIEERID